MFLRLFRYMIVLAVPAVGFSPMFSHLLGYSVPSWGIWVSAILGTIMYVWGGKPFLTGARDEIKSRKPGMMLLIALGITVAFLSSWAATINLIDRELEFWWELALLIVIMLAGHWIEMKSLAQTSSALDSLAALLPDEAERLEEGEIVTVSPPDLRVGDYIIVRPGGRVPGDGKVVDGSAAMDESMMTGESRTVSRSVGDDVVAGTVATDSGLTIEITATGEDTALAGIQKLVADAQSSSSPAQRLADRAAGWLFWFALAAAIIAAIAWTVAGTPQDVVERVITVLVIACPHALGLAIPLVVSISTGKAANSGILIKDRLALETMKDIETVVFDKTGTLTKGTPTVTEVLSSQFSSDELLTLAASAELRSEHPLALAIVNSAKAQQVELREAHGFTSSPAIGVTARIDNHDVAVGGPHLLEQMGSEPLEQTNRWRASGSTVLHVAVDNSIVAALRVDDEIRPESRDAVRALHDRGVDVVMITGDAEEVAASVSEELGIGRYFAGVRPENKSELVASLQTEGKRVAMVGDGVNDAPALAQADVGIAIGAGTDVAIASAEIVLVSDDPRSVVSTIKLSESATRKMKQNLWWAAGYNLVSVPLAAGVLAPIGVVMPMSIGAILMSLSTVIVALNAQLLRRIDLNPESQIRS